MNCRVVDLNLAWRTLAGLPLLPCTVEVLVQVRAMNEREKGGIGKGMESVWGTKMVICGLYVLESSMVRPTPFFS